MGRDRFDTATSGFSLFLVLISFTRHTYMLWSGQRLLSRTMNNGGTRGMGWPHTRPSTLTQVAHHSKHYSGSHLRYTYKIISSTAFPKVIFIKAPMASPIS